MGIKRKQIVGLIIFFLLIFIGYNFFLSESAQVNRVIKRVKKGIEDKDINNCFKYISDNYYDSYGNDYKGLKTFFVNFFEDYSEITLFIVKKKKDFFLGRCEVTMFLIITASSKEYGAIRGREFLKATLYKEDEGWRCIKGEILKQNPFRELKGLPGQKETL